MSRPFITLRQAGFRLGERLIFSGSDWTFECDEHWVLHGGNGAGKSIFAEALRGHLPLVQGELHYHFRPMDGLSAEQLIGHVSFDDRRADLHGAVVQSRWNSLEEDHAVLVRDFLSYDQVMDVNPFAVGVVEEPLRRRFERRRRLASALLGIETFFDRALLTLSNGERQRVQLARALCHPLRLLILDEPFIGMDQGTRKHFHHVLRSLMQSPLRLLLITSREEDVPRGITHALEIDDCRIISSAPIPARRHLKPQSRNLPQPPPTDLESNPNRTTGKGKGKVLVSLREVTVRYGARTILDQVNWEIREGESWALVGRNGSGKSTLLSLINGDNPQAYSNCVRVFGKLRGAGESVWDLKQKIGWVSPELQVHFDTDLTCYEAVASGFFATNGLFEEPTRKQAAAARRWLKTVGLANEAQTPVAGLSAGMQRMILLARCLVKQPRLLILDEPCQGLDQRHRAQFLGRVNALIRKKVTTVIFVTHRADEIPRGIRRVLRLGHHPGPGQAPQVTRP